MPRTGCRPHLVVLQQVGIDEHAQLGGVPERRHTTDREARHPVDGVGIDPAALQTSGGRCELELVELIRSADIGEHDLAVNGEDQALDDLADSHADRCCRVGGGLGAIGEAARLELEAALARRVQDLADIRMQCIHRKDSTVADELLQQLIDRVGQVVVATCDRVIRIVTR